MSEPNQANDELFDTVTEKPEIQPDLESTDNSENVENNNVSAAELNRQKQIDTWKRRVEMGEKTLDDIPHGWIKDAVKSSITPKESIEETVKKAIRAEKEAEAYSNLRGKLNDAGLSEAKQKAVTEEYNDLVDSGLSKAKALAKAVKIVGITFEDTTRYAARIPRPSSKKLSADEAVEQRFKEGEYPSDLSADDRIKALERLRKGN